MALPSTKHLDGICSHCHAPFTFPATSIGLRGPCPHCRQMTELMLAPPPDDDSASRRVTAWTAMGVLVLAVGIGAPLIGLKYMRSKAAAHRLAQPALTNADGVRR